MPEKSLLLVYRNFLLSHPITFTSIFKDEYPKISVKSDLDSVSRGPIQFAGQLSDDYGLTKLNIVYYDSKLTGVKKSHSIKINKAAFEEFYYVFDPQGELNLEVGKDYELYFEVFDLP